jgi:hypothetical protein
MPDLLHQVSLHSGRGLHARTLATLQASIQHMVHGDRLATAVSLAGANPLTQRRLLVELVQAGRVTAARAVAARLGLHSVLDVLLRPAEGTWRPALPLLLPGYGEPAEAVAGATQAPTAGVPVTLCADVATLRALRATLEADLAACGA